MTKHGTKRLLSLILTLSLALTVFVIPVQAAGNEHYNAQKLVALKKSSTIAIVDMDLYAIFNGSESELWFDDQSYLSLSFVSSNLNHAGYNLFLLFIPDGSEKEKQATLLQSSYTPGTQYSLNNAELISCVAENGAGSLRAIISDADDSSFIKNIDDLFFLGHITPNSFTGTTAAAETAASPTPEEIAAAQAAAAVQATQNPAETPAAPTAEEIAAAEAAAAAQAAAAAAETPTAPAGSYTVEKGDCLFKIAQKAYGDGKLWRKIYEANKDQIKNSKEYIIYAGQNFVIPAIQ